MPKQSDLKFLLIETDPLYKRKSSAIKILFIKNIRLRFTIEPFKNKATDGGIFLHLAFKTKIALV